MRTLCDFCECTAAVIFCTADQAALCSQCDEKVHSCNKFASRHARVQLVETSAIGRCDICESSPAFFFCAIDGSSLCLECDLFVHIGGKKSHERYLVLKQKIEFFGDKSGNFEDLVLQHNDNDEKMENYGLNNKKRVLQHMRDKIDCCRVPHIQVDIDHHEFTAIDLNARPHRIPDQVTPSSQTIHPT